MESLSFKEKDLHPIFTKEVFYREVKKTGGLNQGELITIAGRSGCGKTAFALNLMSDFLMNNIKCLYVSCEMTRYELARRIGKSLSKLNEKIPNKKQCFIEDSDFSLKNIENCIKDSKCRVVFIDYIQLLDGKIRQNSKTLKQLAQKYKCTIFVLSQLNRLAIDKEPNLLTISRSDAIVHDSDQIWLLHDTKMTDKEYSIILVDIAKNRKGKTFKTFTLFDKEYQFFANAKEKDEKEYFEDYEVFKSDQEFYRQLKKEDTDESPRESNNSKKGFKTIIDRGHINFYDEDTGIIFRSKK